MPLARFRCKQPKTRGKQSAQVVQKCYRNTQTLNTRSSWIYHIAVCAGNRNFVCPRRVHNVIFDANRCPDKCLAEYGPHFTYDDDDDDHRHPRQGLKLRANPMIVGDVIVMNFTDILDYTTWNWCRSLQWSVTDSRTFPWQVQRWSEVKRHEATRVVLTN